MGETHTGHREENHGNGDKDKVESRNVYLLGVLMRNGSVVLISIMGAEVCTVFEHKPQKHRCSH